MVHELIGIQDNKVDLRNTGKVPKDQQVDSALSVCTAYCFHIQQYSWLMAVFGIHAYRRLCCHLNKIPFLKLICMRILEI